MQALSRAGPRQLRHAGPSERRAVEYPRQGTVTLGGAFNGYDGTRRGWCGDKNDPAHFLGCVRQVARHYRPARRLPLSMDHGGSPIEHHTTAYFSAHPRLRAVSTPAHASWLKQAALLLRAFTDKDLDRCECESRPQLIDHLKASWPEYNRRFAHPFDWSWTRRDLDARAEKKGAAICTKTYATVH